MQDNNRALEIFLASVERRAYRMACIATSNSDEALDIVQDSMFSLVKKYAFKPRENWNALFFKILQSKIRDWYRRTAVRNRWRVWLDTLRGNTDENQEDPISAAPDPDGESPEEQMIVNDSMKTLESALQTLSLRQQQVFLLRAWEGLNVSDTAAAMRCSEGSVKTHYSRAVQNLKKLLEDHWP
jgi:RNA polymerase sigma-70 factor (ECF subfamily)